MQDNNKDHTKKSENPDAPEKQNEQPLKQNPNPRANENIPEEKRKEEPDNTEGVGSEITDGEDG